MLIGLADKNNLQCDEWNQVVMRLMGEGSPNCGAEITMLLGLLFLNIVNNFRQGLLCIHACALKDDLLDRIQ